MAKNLGIICFGAALLAVTAANADTAKKKDIKVKPPVVTEASREASALEEIRNELRTGKTQVLEDLMQFSSEEQAKKFWEVYRNFQSELIELNNRRVGLIDDYLTKYQTISDDEASKLIDRSVDEQQALLDLREKYAKILSKETSPVVAASFLQIENVLQSVIDLEVKSNLPLLANRINDTDVQVTQKTN